LASTLVGATGGEASDAAEPPSFKQELAGEAS
jgi:hypothetical protein